MKRVLKVFIRDYRKLMKRRKIFYPQLLSDLKLMEKKGITG